MTPEEYLQLKKQFDHETDDLLNQICDTFHNELKQVADKYGSIIVSLKLSSDTIIDDEQEG